MSDRALPHNLEAEKAVLSACLINPAAFPQAAAILDVADFFREAHRLLFRAMVRLELNGREIDLVTLKTELNPTDLEAVGGAAYIASLTDGAAKSTNVSAYAAIVKETSRKRALISSLNSALASAYVDDVEASTLVGILTDRIAPISVSSAPAIAPFPTLRERLARPVTEQAFRIQGLLPWKSRAVFSAQFKSGKTTAVGNITQALADGSPLFGVFPVVPRENSVVMGLDFEMHDGQLDEWYRCLRIRNDDRVLMQSMRGRASDFNILDRSVRSQWARQMRAQGVTDLIIDCLRPILDALGLDESKDSGYVLAAIDALIYEADIQNLIQVHHMGHNGERSRGDSRIRDWPDVEWSVVRKSDDPASPRFFRAYGRDVDVPEGQLGFDRETRRLTLVGGSRQDAKFDAVIDDVVEALKGSDEPLSGLAIKSQLRDTHGKNIVDESLRRGVESGRLLVASGQRNAKLYRIGSVSQFPRVSLSIPRDTARQFPSFPPSFKKGETGSSPSDGGSHERL